MINKALLIGNLGADPEVRHFPSGDSVVTIRLATSRRWNNKQGQKQEETEWHRVVFFGKLADIVSQYLKKGSQVYIEGRIRTQKWHDKEGHERYSTEIVAESMQMLGGRGNNQSGQQSEPTGNAGSTATNSASDPDDFDDQIPF